MMQLQSRPTLSPHRQRRGDAPAPAALLNQNNIDLGIWRFL
jgi:hypothetical protein